MSDIPDYADSEQAEEAFYAAFENADLEAMMRLWADDDTIICVHPGGTRLVGREAIRESWRQIFDGRMRLRFRITGHHCLTDEGVAVHSVHEEIEVTGQDRVAAVVASTNVFVLTDAGWRIWMHHASSTAKDDEMDDSGPRPTLH